jgi:hypothetical protein
VTDRTKVAGTVPFVGSVSRRITIAGNVPCNRGAVPLLNLNQLKPGRTDAA